MVALVSLPMGRLAFSAPTSSKLLLRPHRLRLDVIDEIVHPFVFGLPTNTLAPAGNTSAVASHIGTPTVVLLHLLWGERLGLRDLSPFVFDHCRADGLDGREEGVLSGDAEVIAGFTVTYSALLGFLVNQLVEVTEVADIDVGPDVGTCKSAEHWSKELSQDNSPLPTIPACPRSKDALIRVGIWSENEFAIPFSYSSPLPSPQMVDGMMMYALQIPSASACSMSRSTSRWIAVGGRVAIESKAGDEDVAGVGFKSVKI